MSKESSIKVYAENFSGSDKPVNAIPVWIENASAISGGGGGGGSIPSDVSGKWENASDVVQSNSASWSTSTIPTNLSANNISARYSLNVGNVDKDEWGNFNGDGLLVDKSHLYIHPNDVRAGDQGVISLTSISGNWDSRVTVTGEINAFDWNKVNDASNCVQTNSAQWSQGGGSDTPENVLFHKYRYVQGFTDSIYNYVSGVSELNFECCLDSYINPQDLIINQYGIEVTRVYWTQVSSDVNHNYYSGSCKGLQTNSEYEINTNNVSYNWCYMSANGYKTNAAGFTEFESPTNSVVKFNVYGYNITGHIYGDVSHGLTQLTSFTGSLSDFTAKGYQRYNYSIGIEDQFNSDYNYNISAEFNNSEPTVTSGDVFPPTTGLTQGSKYYLAWNTNNGGLYWEYVGN